MNEANQMPDGDSGQARELVELMKRSLTDTLAADNQGRELDRLVASWHQELHQESANRSRQRRFVGIAGIAFATGAILLGWQVWRRPSDLHVVPGASVAEQTDSTGGKRYLFPDGSTVSLSADAAVAVIDAQSRLPRVRVSRGKARVSVVHRPDTRWTFLAGPFEVDVVGTVFDLGWNPADNSLSLTLRQGRVNLRGPLLANPLQVQSGQQVFVSLRTGQVSVAETASPESANQAPSAKFAQQPEEVREPAPLPSPNAAPAASEVVTTPPSRERRVDRGHALSEATPGQVSWRALVGRGQFRQVITEAQSLSLNKCFAACSAEDLRALGDAARYLSRHDLAELAFRSLRRRYVGTTDGAVAAFLLGRTCEDKQRWEEAGSWYARYLAESPKGEFAIEAASGRHRVAKMR